MSKSKAANTDSTTDNTGIPIQVLKQGTCPTTSGKSTLTYQLGLDESDGIHLKISGNDGGGFWSAEWVRYTDIQAALKTWPADEGVTSITFRKIFRGKSANTPGFLIAVLCAEGIIEPQGDKKRVHQVCDPKPFLAKVEALRKGTASTPTSKAKEDPKAKEASNAKSPAKVKTPAKPTAKTAKTPRPSGKKQTQLP